MGYFGVWTQIYPAVAEALSQMIDRMEVTEDHPRYGECCRGKVTAIILRPSENDVFQVVPSVEVQENGIYHVHITNPEYLRLSSGGFEKEVQVVWEK